MTNKLILYGVGNEGTFNHYTFDKIKKVQVVLTKIFKDVLNVDFPSVKEFENEKGEFECIEINVEENKDFHEALGNSKPLGSPRVDIFYGQKRMFVVIHCSLEKRKELHKIIQEKFVMPNIKTKKLPQVKI